MSARVQLRRIFRVVNGGTPTQDPEHWNGDVPWATPVDLAPLYGGVLGDTARRLTPGGVRSGSALVPAGSLILSTRAPIGYVARVLAPTAFNQGCRGLVPRVAVSRRYFAYQLLALRPELAAAGQGSTFIELSSSQLGGIPLLVPPVEEQRGIADFLDAETARIDALIAKKRRLIELLGERLQARIDEQFDDASGTWGAEPLRRLAFGVGGIFTDGDWVEAPFITDEGIRLIQTGNVGTGTYREQGWRYISAASFRELRCTEVVPGDVLICRLAEPVGRACLAPDLGVPMITAVDVCILRPRWGIDRRFLVNYLSSTRYLGEIDAIARGGTRQRVSREQLGSVKVPLPPLNQQRAIADLLAKERRLLSGVLQKLARQIDLLAERRQTLITAAVTRQIPVPA